MPLELHFFSLIFGLVIGVLIGWLITKVLKSNSTSPDHISKDLYESTLNQLDISRDDGIEKGKNILALTQKMAAKEQELLHFEEQIFTLKNKQEDLQEHFRKEFENLANKLLEEKSSKFLHQNETQLNALLNPFKERLQSFEQQISRRAWEESQERISLKKEIEQLRELNIQLSEDAHSLTNALKGDNKTQGDWGELRLELILERAGLQRGVHFDSQQSYRDDVGRLKRPDFIINLPKQKHLIIDAKVSLTAYEAFHREDNPQGQEKYLKQHLLSLRNHIKSLSSKNYEGLYQINSPDYLLLFVPLESALLLALQKDQQLFLDALDNNIVLVSSTTLLATMRTVAYIWKQENQNNNVLEIARQSGLLYDKFCNFIEDLQDIGKRLDQTQSAYKSAMNKLSESTKYGDTLLGRAEKLKALGAKTTKTLPKDFVA